MDVNTNTHINTDTDTNLRYVKTVLAVIALSLFFLAVLSIVSCSSTAAPNVTTPAVATNDATSPAQRIYNEYGRRLEITANLVNTLLEAAGEAHGDGTLSDTQLEKVRTLGHQLESAFDTAKSTLKLYIATSGSVSESDKASLSEKMVAYDRLVIQLQETLRHGGVI